MRIALRNSIYDVAMFPMVPLFAYLYYKSGKVPYKIRSTAVRFFCRNNILWFMYAHLQFIIVLVVSIALTRNLLTSEGYALIQDQVYVLLPFEFAISKFTDVNQIHDVILLGFGLLFESVLLNRHLLYFGFMWEGYLYEEG